MKKRAITGETPSPALQKTSLNLVASIYDRAEDYLKALKRERRERRETGEPRNSMGRLVSQALDEYLKKRGA